MAEVKFIGNVYNQSFGASYAGAVFDTDGLSPTLTTMQGGGREPMTIEIVAMRGRNPENPSDRTAGIQLEQRLEPNSEGICNTLTSVQKDNLVMERTEIQVLGNYMPSEHDASRVVSVGGVAPAVRENHGTVTAVVESKEVIPSKTIKIRQATKDGFIDCEIGGVADLNYPTSTTRRGRVQEGGQVSPTLTTENIPSVIEKTESDPHFLYLIDGQLWQIRIRKLTPKECWRLMSFTDADFEKAEQVNSNTQLYKQAGNSIVKEVLMAIFKNMF